MSGGPFLIGTFVSNCGGGHGVCVFAESVFIVRPEIGMTEKLSKLGSRGLQGFSSEGGIIKLNMKGRSSWVVLSFVIKSEQFSWGEGEFLTYSLVVVGVAEAFLSCWGRGGIIVAYACSFCQG